MEIVNDEQLKYNTSQPKLIIPEYGRNIQKMIDYAINVKDKEERNKVARSIIDIMGQLNPHLRDVTDFKHKLWDHLFIISDFKLDVDSPYPKPTRETFISKPDQLKYPSRKIKYGHYGKTVERLIEKAIEYTEGEEKQALVASIANLMKRSYLNWNRDSVTDEVIIKQLEQLSGGKLKLPEDFKLNNTADMLPRNTSSGSGKKRNHRNDKHRNNRGRHNRNHKH